MRHVVATFRYRILQLAVIVMRTVNTVRCVWLRARSQKSGSSIVITQSMISRKLFAIPAVVAFTVLAPVLVPVPILVGTFAAVMGVDDVAFFLHILIMKTGYCYPIGIITHFSMRARNLCVF